MSVPPSPPALRRSRPAWLNLRLLAGVLLVVVSVAVGARVVGSADRTSRVWSTAGDLAAGTTLTGADLVPVRVRLLGAAHHYLTADPAAAGAVVGRTLSRPVAAGELLPRAAVTARACGGEVSIPVGPRHVPVSVRHGSRVAVFATARRPDGSGGQGTGLVLADVTVQSVTRPPSGLVSTAGDWAIVVRVADSLTLDVVRAVRTADIDVVLVRSDPPGGARADGCGRVRPPPAAPGTTGAPTVNAGSDPPGASAPVPATPAPAPGVPTVPPSSSAEGQSLARAGAGGRPATAPAGQGGGP